jgi:hypothetical protein
MARHGRKTGPNNRRRRASVQEIERRIREEARKSDGKVQVWTMCQLERCDGKCGDWHRVR